jgi:hypothetical protein
MWDYIKRVLIGVDQLINSICNGNPDETISSRVGRRRDSAERFFAWIVDKLFFWDKDHTKNSIEGPK